MVTFNWNNLLGKINTLYKNIYIIVFVSSVVTCPLKFISGYEEYSDCQLLLFRRGKVQRKALANRQAIWTWLNDTEWLWFCFSRGIGLVINVGNCNANLIIFGSKLLKNDSVSSSLKHYNDTN